MKIKWFPITAALAVGDQAVKCYAENKLVKGEERPITEKVVLRHVQNKGICMSLLEDEPKTAHILSGAASGAVLGWHAFTVMTKKKGFWKKFGLSLMAAGSASNLFDRIVRGHVVDYVGFRCEDKQLAGITYNFADFFIAAGTVITIIAKLFSPRAKKREKGKKTA
ncbi:signal peptidase II [Mediterraneibacter sp.]|mgnify:CR=1 FL=1|jgi:signal peptidase II|uniref:signal peptidase II n=1 Tax=Mediterraneibacter sp. TaxID=2316022 RepID=UPI0015B1684F|nr:signal peptidase II [Mediterraneibacter sp.]